MPRRDQQEDLTLEEALDRLTVDQLKPLVALIHRPAPTRKGELVGYLTKTMLDSVPNIVLILADDLGYADVGVHGPTSVCTAARTFPRRTSIRWRQPVPLP